MRRLFVFMIGLIGLGVVMSGCVANGFRDTKVKDAYIQKNYIDKVKVPESKKVGDKNIKFYVGKVKDERKDKAVYVKRGPFWIRTGDTEFANTELTIRNITEKALLNTGWGVVENRDRADFVVETELKDFAEHWGVILPKDIAESYICVYKGDKKVLKKEIYAKKDYHSPFFVDADLTVQFKFVVGRIAKLYYKALLGYFSSPEFVKAIKEAYAKENDDSTKVKE